MSVQQKINFVYGQDSDTASELKKGFPYLYNVRILSTSGEDGSVTTVNGNTIVAHSLPIGNNTCIGYYEYVTHKKGYAFIYNDTLRHSIIEFNAVTNTISNVFIDDGIYTQASRGSILNFQKDYLITGINVVEVDDDNHLLKWTDNYVNINDASDYNQPKSINIEQGILYALSAGAGTDFYKNNPSFKPRYIYAIITPPDAPTYVWGGLGDYKIVATTNTGGVSDPTNLKFPFNVASTNVGGEFDTTNYWWLVGVSSGGNYQISITMNVVNTSPYINYIHLNKNGSLYDSISVPSGSNGVVTNNYFVTTVAGDVWDIYVGDFVSDTNLFGTSVANFSVIKSDSLLLINNNFQRLFTFQSNVITKNNEVSVLSKVCSYVLPKTLLSPTSDGETYNYQDNKITITVDTGDSTIRKIRIYGTEIGATQPLDTLLSTTSLIIELDKDVLGIDDNTTYDYIFLNDGNYTPINLQQATQLQDFIPLYAQAQELFKNRIGYGNVTDSVTAIPIDARISVDCTNTVQTNTNSFFPAVSYLKSGAIYEFGWEYGLTGGRESNAFTAVGKSTEININNGIYGTQFHLPFLTETGYNAPTSDPDLLMQYVPQVTIETYNEPVSDAIDYSILRSKQQNILQYIQFVSQAIFYYAATDTSFTSPLPYPYIGANFVGIDISNITGRYKQENGGSQLVYNWTKGDRIRFITQANITSTGIYNNMSPRYSYNDNEIFSYNTPNTLGLAMINLGTAPIPMGSFVLFEIYTPARNIENDNELVYEVGEGGTIGLDANGFLAHFPKENGLTTVNQLTTIFTSNAYTPTTTIVVTVVSGGASYTAGQKVKIIGVNNVWSVYGSVASSTSTTITVTIDVTSWFNIGGYINTGGKIVRGASQILTSGDCFRPYCNMPQAYGSNPVTRTYSYIERMNASNMFNSEAWDYGRPNRIDNNAKRLTRPATVVYSEQLVPQSNINGLATFYDTSLQEYSNEFGGIQKLYYINNTLEAYQTLKVIPILIEQQLLQSPAGGGIIATSPPVLSPQGNYESYYRENFGMTHAESGASYAFRFYFLDANNAQVVRRSNNGLTGLPMESNMRIAFSNLCTAILAEPTRVKCVGTYDIKYGTYILMVEPFSAYPNGFTIEWNEAKNMFGSNYGYQGDFLGQNGNNILSFKNGGLWLHDTNALQNNFYGEQQNSEIWFYINVEPSKVKVLEALSQETSNNWICTEISTPNGQLTRMMYDSNWVEKERNYYAYCKKDINTPNPVGNPIITGNPMRDRVFLVKMRYDKSVYSKLYAINAYIVGSERSDK